VRIHALVLFASALPLSAAAQPSLVGDPLREDFTDFTGGGFAPGGGAGRLDSDAWRVTGIAAGDLAFGDTAEAGAYARGAASGAVDEGGVYAFTTGGATLGLQPTNMELTPGALEARFVNGTGAALDSFTVAYDCWQWNDAARAVDLDVEVEVDGAVTGVAALDCTGTPAADATPEWQRETLSAVATPSAPVADGATVIVRFVVDSRGGGAAYDQVALDAVVFGLVDSCGNGLDEAGDACDDGDPCTTDACVEPGGCVFTPIADCGVDGGVGDGGLGDGGLGDGGLGDAGLGDAGGATEPTDAQVPPRYDSGVFLNGYERVDLGATDGPAADGCDCRTSGPGASFWPLGLTLLFLRRRRR